MITGALILLAAATVAGPVESNGRIAHVHPAHVFYLDEALVPAEQTGPIVSIAVKIGDHVKVGQMLARIDDEQLRRAKTAAELEREVALEKASDNIEIEYSIASHALAESELRHDIQINVNSPGAVALSEIDRKELAEHRMRLQIERSRRDKRIAEKNARIHDATVAAAAHAVQRCLVEAPFTGRVVDILRHQSEWVDAGQGVMHVVRLDKLHVDGLLDASEYDPHELEGRRVQVDVRLAREQIESFIGEVVFVNPQIQAGNKYRIRAEIQNRIVRGRWLLGAGHSADMYIFLDVINARQNERLKEPRTNRHDVEPTRHLSR
ncbi:MAG: HlyD family efflux transporter periplasmic adaptor subunit [Pirellulaceae bacterium]